MIRLLARTVGCILTQWFNRTISRIQTIRVLSGFINAHIYSWKETLKCELIARYSSATPKRKEENKQEMI